MIGIKAVRQYTSTAVELIKMISSCLDSSEYLTQWLCLDAITETAFIYVWLSSSSLSNFNIAWMGSVCRRRVCFFDYLWIFGCSEIYSRGPSHQWPMRPFATTESAGGSSGRSTLCCNVTSNPNMAHIRLLLITAARWLTAPVFWPFLHWQNSIFFKCLKLVENFLEKLYSSNFIDFDPESYGGQKNQFDVQGQHRMMA